MSVKWTTQELLNEYFKDNPEAECRRGNIEKPLLFQYETEIEKPLVDMDRNEMIELIFRYAKDTADYHPYISPSTVDNMVSRIRVMLDWYSKHGDKQYQNVLKDSSQKSESILWGVIQKAGRVTLQDFQNIIRKLHNDSMMNYSINGQDYTRADYFELLMLLFYSGFYEPKEIIKVTETAMNMKNKTCELPDRTLTLTDRTFELLTAFHEQGFLTTMNGNSVIQHPLCAWHDSYLKFFVQSSKIAQFNNRSESTVAHSISHNIAHWAGNKCSTWVCSKALYWLGVHDRLAALFGEEELSKMIVSDDPKHNTILFKAWKPEIAYLMGFNEFKRCLWQFIDPKVALLEM